MSGSPIVIKVSGDYVEQPEMAAQLAKAVANLAGRQPCVLVHGGGRAIDEWLKRLGIQPAYQNGLRVTDERTLEVAEMILSGQVNKRLTMALLGQNVDALGMSGVDRGLIRAEPLSPELGRVGRVAQVRAEVLLDLCAQGVVPVISPISSGADGRYNLNADHVAGAIAGAVQAARVIFLTNVPGVQVDGSIVTCLAAAQAQGLIAGGVITGGMIPKINAALEALASGAAEVVITDLAGLLAGTGTAFVTDNQPEKEKR